MEAFKALLKQITSFWAGKDKRFKRNAIIIGVSALAAVIVISIIANQVPYSTLYSGLSAADSATVIKALDDQKEPKRVVGDAILVPSKDVDELRLTLSAKVKDTFNLDILKQGQGLGMTESDKADYRKAQLESDIQNSIKTIQGVADARVLLTLPESSGLVISSANQDATASLLLTLDPGVELTPAQVKAIKGFVQKAVQGLKMENISAMNSDMQSLDDGSSGDFGSANDQFALQGEVEAKLRQQIMALLMPVFGMGHVETQVNAVLNFDDSTTDSTTVKPVVNDKDGVITSYDKLKEMIVNGANASGEPGTTTNTGTSSYPAAASGSNGTYEKTEDKVNYAVNTIQQHIIAAKGKLQQLSVSVVVDSNTFKTDLTDNLKSLVKNAVGVDMANISVEYVPMAGTQASLQASSNGSKQAAQAQAASSLLPIVIGGGVGLLAVILLAALFSRARKSSAPQPQAQAANLYGGMGPATEADERQEMEDELSAIKIVKDSSAKEQISKLIEKNPELVANLLRSWLADEQE